MSTIFPRPLRCVCTAVWLVGLWAAPGCQGLFDGGLAARPAAAVKPPEEPKQEPPVDPSELRTAHDPHRRAAVMQRLARQRHPQTAQLAAEALRDSDLEVRLAAVAALGEIGGREAESTLQNVLKDRAEAMRAAAVAALATSGARGPVIDAAADPSWRVRIVVADALARYADHDGVVLARQLIDDRSAEVELRVVTAVAKWPTEQAGPVLLAAMGKSAYQLRKTAAQQLAARWPPAAEFSVDDPPARRRAALERLEAAYRQQFSQVDPAVLAQATRAVSPLPPGEGDRAHPGPRPEGEGAEVQAAMERLRTTDVQERRRAAADLARLGAKTPLPASAAAQLTDLVIVERDALVWQCALQAMACDGSEPAGRLAYAAISHPLPDVRRLACEYLAAHPHPRHAAVLVPALDDPSQPVVAAAARALGAIGKLPDSQPLRRVLTATDEETRLAAAVALVRLGDPAGAPAVERLSYSNDPKIRMRAAQAMGQLADPTFAAALVRLLDDRNAVSLAALESLPKVVGQDVAREGTARERIRRWKQWKAQHP